MGLARSGFSKEIILQLLPKGQMSIRWVGMRVGGISDKSNNEFYRQQKGARQWFMKLAIIQYVAYIQYRGGNNQMKLERLNHEGPNVSLRSHRPFSNRRRISSCY